MKTLKQLLVIVMYCLTMVLFNLIFMTVYPNAFWLIVFGPFIVINLASVLAILIAWIHIKIKVNEYDN